MKDFLLICDKNCATYKEVFPLFKDGIVSFGSPVKEYEGTDKKFGNHSWITTFSVPNKKKLILTATYDPALYPKYDNYDAIEIGHYTKNGKWEGSLDEIPYDYEGVMGVPITFLDQYSPNQFEIVGLAQGAEDVAGPFYLGYVPTINYNGGKTRPYVRGKAVYTRILIRRKK